MDTREAYNAWAGQYDTNDNKTRDLEALALRNVLAKIPFSHCLEIGCGTGKNTVWLMENAEGLTAVDLSEEMLARARDKIQSKKVQFIQADISMPWAFGDDAFDLVSFSLVLEHINDLKPIFVEAARALRTGGYVYIGELHPFKQYMGSKARFETDEGRHVLQCFNHHLSDFMHAAINTGMRLEALEEFFDVVDSSEIPRILALLFRKL